jgi:hypothetical protein
MYRHDLAIGINEDGIGRPEKVVFLSENVRAGIESSWKDDVSTLDERFGRIGWVE